MSAPVISVEGIGKAYRIGMANPTHTSFGEHVFEMLKTPLKRLRMKSEDWSDAEDTYWAIRDINFQVFQGEVCGIIGRNGAGKSTLLKVLSRITEPTEGLARVRGRVASLLEVGTGFHPELSGRENIYLNGAILGMTKAEIKRKFDEIVEFSEIGKFLDTPVKRYSSGMYVRLAFSVAAHLEPEVLIVDEVLAVGDASFQKKCLGKMGDVVKEGRTVLFVSHNMDAVATLCTHCVLIDRGRASERLSSDEGVKRYTALANVDEGIPLKDRPRKQNHKRPHIFQNLTMHTNSGHRNIVECGGEVTFEIEAQDFEELRDATCGVAIHNDRGNRILFFHTRYHSGFTFDGEKRATFKCRVPNLPLIPGSYYVELVMSDGYGIIEQIERVDRLDITPANILGTGMLPRKHQGFFVLPAHWTKE
jgi:lipopolysaccharide transport system ATP-binding protein